MAKDNKDFFKEKKIWSVIKDDLLIGYLEPYFQKLLASHKPIYYVDCFAGKGKFDDGNVGSPLIALEARRKCLQRTTNQSQERKIETCFIDWKYAAELRKNIDETYFVDGKIDIISGRYEDNIERILCDRQNQNVFLYIDPYGIKNLNFELFNNFQTYEFNTFEMLINFNSFGFFRDACRVMKVDTSQDDAFQDLNDLVEYDPEPIRTDKRAIEMLSRVAGGTYWQNIVEDYKQGKIDGYQAEERLSKGYKQQLRRNYNYVLDIPVRLKANQRPKYRMIHVCDHEDGCYLMAGDMIKRKDELVIGIQQDNQISIFNRFPTSAEGNLLTSGEIKEKVKSLLKNSSVETNITKFIAMFLTEYGLICDFHMIHGALSDMENEGDIEILRDPEKTRTGRKSHFWEEKNRSKVIIRKHLKP